MSETRGEDEDEWEDETMLLVELSGIIDSNWADKCGSKCKLVGLDTEKPLLQWDRYVFLGEYCDILGTAVFFEKKKGEDGSVESLKYDCHTFKKLSMVRAFLSEKEDLADGVNPSTSGDGTGDAAKSEPMEEDPASAESTASASDDVSLNNSSDALKPDL